MTLAKRVPKRALALALALCLAWGLALPALAIVVPERPENQYVLDEAGVLSEETEQEIITQNQSLFEETGAQIAVAAVDFLGGEDIEDYANYMFNYWGVGDYERNNGLLLVLAIGEDNYYATSGYGIEDYFDGAKLQSMLDEYLEPDFAVQEYDTGVKKFFEAALSEMEGYYAGYTEPASLVEDPSYDSYEEPSFAYDVGRSVGQFFGRVLQIIVILGVVLVISLVLRAMRNGGGRGGPRSGGGGGGFWTGMFLGNMMGSSRRRGGWRPPPPPPGGFGPRPPRGGGGFGGGFRSGGRSGGFGGSRGGGGGFRSGGGSRGGGAGRR